MIDSKNKTSDELIKDELITKIVGLLPKDQLHSLAKATFDYKIGEKTGSICVYSKSESEPKRSEMWLVQLKILAMIEMVEKNGVEAKEINLQLKSFSH